MKSDRSITGTLATLQDVLDRLAVADGLTEARRRDLASAVRTYAKIIGMPPAAIPLDLAAIRERLDAMVPAEAKVSAKRWANRRSDLAAAFAACGLMPILKTPGPQFGAMFATAFRRDRLSAGCVEPGADIRSSSAGTAPFNL